MNGADTLGNRGTVHARTQILSAALAALLAAGCAGQGHASYAATEPGTTTIFVENHVGAPDALDRLVVSIDGADVALSSVPPPAGDPAVVALLRLPPGQHTIAIRATARGVDQNIAVVAAQQIFHLQEDPAAISVDVRSREAPAEEADQRLAVDLRMRGGQLSPELGAPQPEGKDERCAPLRPIPRALCRAAADLAHASEHNDTVSALCVGDKLTEMRRLAQVAETADHDTAMLAEQQVTRISREVDRCAGDEVLIGADGITVTRVKVAPR